MRENVRCEIYCQKGKSFYPEITLNTEGWEEEGLYVEMAEHMTKDCWERSAFALKTLLIWRTLIFGQGDR